MNGRQCPVRNTCLLHSLRAASQQCLGITHTLLADRTANAGRSHLKEAGGTVTGSQVNKLLCLPGGQVHDIGSLIQRQADFCPLNLLQGITYLAEYLR